MATILAVDDSTSLRQMVSFVLRNEGHDVVEAADGEQGLSAAKSRKFDLVITDVNMPRMDGLSLVKALRDLPAYRTVPLLMLTTESGDDMKQRGEAVGATGWIVKPVNPDKLQSVIKRLLD